MSYTQRSSSGRARESTDLGSGVGSVLFAGIMMLLVGIYQVIIGLVAIFDDGYFLVPRSGLIINTSYSAWGTVHLLLGVLLVATGLGAMRGQLWARVAGITLAVISAVVNLGFLAANPVWVVIVIAIDVIIIHALAVHGAMAKDL